jgi:glutaredoxin
VTRERALVLSYIGEDGRFAEASQVDDVPAAGRRVVRVVDPAQPPTARTDTNQVFVVDLRQADATGHYPVRRMDRGAFETLALAQLSPGQLSPLPLPKVGPGAPGPAGADEGVILYGTAWCGFCKAARAYLKERGVAFVDKDVEKDGHAAQELMRKMAAAGLAPGGVPVIDVHGTLLQGFDRARLDALLGKGGGVHL